MQIIHNFYVEFFFEGVFYEEKRNDKKTSRVYRYY